MTTLNRRTPTRAITRQLLGAVLGAAASLAAACSASHAAAPPPKVDAAPHAGLETAVLSGGCFWGIQGVFEHVRGVKKVWSGYAGGLAATAHYEVVGTGLTGHAESVQITFDPREISYGRILQIFFSVATDPTQVNMQFPDRGTQYRNEIWYTTPDQQRVAAAYVRQLDAAHAFSKPIATRVDPLKGFYKAEGYHQDYLVLHPDQPYIYTYDLPKVDALKREFPTAYRADPVLVGG